MKNLQAPYIVKFVDAYAVINPQNGTSITSAETRDGAVDALVAAVQQWLDNGHKHDYQSKASV